MNATLVHVRDPFRPHINRDIQRLSRRTRIDTLLRRQGLITGRGRKMRRLSVFVVRIGNGDYMTASQWGRSVADGELITIINVPAGGNTMRLVAMVAIAVLAAYTGGAAAGLASSAGWGAAGASAAGMAASVAVTVAGSLVGTALTPPEVRK